MYVCVQRNATKFIATALALPLDRKLCCHYRCKSGAELQIVGLTETLPITQKSSSYLCMYVCECKIGNGNGWYVCMCLQNCKCRRLPRLVCLHVCLFDSWRIAFGNVEIAYTHTPAATCYAPQAPLAVSMYINAKLSKRKCANGVKQCKQNGLDYNNKSSSKWLSCKLTMLK